MLEGDFLRRQGYYIRDIIAPAKQATRHVGRRYYLYDWYYVMYAYHTYHTSHTSHSSHTSHTWYTQYIQFWLAFHGYISSIQYIYDHHPIADPPGGSKVPGKPSSRLSRNWGFNHNNGYGFIVCEAEILKQTWKSWKSLTHQMVLKFFFLGWFNFMIQILTWKQQGKTTFWYPELNMVRLQQTNRNFQDFQSLIVGFPLPSQALKQEGYTHDVFLPAVVPAQLTQWFRCAKGAWFTELIWASCSSDTVPGTVHRNWLPGGEVLFEKHRRWFAYRDSSENRKGRIHLYSAKWVWIHLGWDFKDVAQFLLPLAIRKMSREQVGSEVEFTAFLNTKGNPQATVDFFIQRDYSQKMYGKQWWQHSKAQDTHWEVSWPGRRWTWEILLLGASVPERDEAYSPLLLRRIQTINGCFPKFESVFAWWNYVDRIKQCQGVTIWVACSNKLTVSFNFKQL